MKTKNPIEILALRLNIANDSYGSNISKYRTDGMGNWYTFHTNKSKTMKIFDIELNDLFIKYYNNDLNKISEEIIKYFVTNSGYTKRTLKYISFEKFNNSGGAWENVY